jgi:hypothetical protein
MKRSREYRFEQKERVIKKRFRLVKDTFPDMTENYQNKKNYLATHDPFDCGKSNCQLCRTHKKEWDKIKKMKLPLEDNEDA